MLQALSPNGWKKSLMLKGQWVFLRFLATSLTKKRREMKKHQFAGEAGVIFLIGVQHMREIQRECSFGLLLFNQ